MLVYKACSMENYRIKFFSISNYATHLRIHNSKSVQDILEHKEEAETYPNSFNEGNINCYQNQRWSHYKNKQIKKN
jgi:hypothetical protein